MVRRPARARIAAAYGEEFGVAPPYPTSFPGVPVLNNLNSWFFVREKDRGEHDIDALWDLARAAIDYAADANEATRERLVATFDACPGVGARKLSIAIYWIRPGSFASYDSTSTAFLKRKFPEIAARLSLDAKLAGEQILANTEILAAWIADPTSPFNSFPELSHAAWNALSTPEPDPDPDHPSDAEADVLGGESYDLEAIRDQGASSLRRSWTRCSSVSGPGRTSSCRALPAPERHGWADGSAGRSATRGTASGSRCCSSIRRSPTRTSSEDGGRRQRPDSSSRTARSRMCTRAGADPDNEYVLVIEEIGRGNPAQIFGELLTLIEADKRSPEQAMRLAYPRSKEEVFFLPSNLRRRWCRPGCPGRGAGSRCAARHDLATGGRTRHRPPHQHRPTAGC